MKLYIDGLRLVGNRSGVGRYIEYLLKYWARMKHPFTKMYLYTPKPVDLELPEGIENIVIPAKFSSSYWEQVLLPRAHQKRSLLFCPSYVVPLLSRCKIILTHHGSYERYPAEFTWWQRAKSKSIYKASAKKAGHIITVSQSSKRDIMEFYGISSDKITVIPMGVDTELFSPTDNNDYKNAIRRKYTGSDLPYILYVGKFSRRRNVPSLIKAVMLLKKEKGIPHKLLLVGTDIDGSPVTKLIEKEGMRDSVTVVPHLSHGEILGLYQAADLFIYPSSYEGFGMPVLEAMACGIPAIALHNTAFLEFADGVAYLASNGSSETLYEAIDNVLNDESLRRRMCAQGPRRAKKYDWSGVAAKTMDILVREAAKN